MKKKNNITIILLLVLSVILIASALFYSREETRTFSFEVGTPWRHSRLEANFQYDIELNEETRRHITDSVNQNFAKIYTFDRKKGEQQQALLIRALAGRPGGQAVVNAVAKLYNDGIVDNEAANDIRAGKQFHNTLRLALKEEWACDYHIHIALPIKSNDASQSFHTGSRPSSRRRWFIVWAVRSSLTVNCSRACG